MSYQKWLVCILVVAGAIALGCEYLLVRWYPGHETRVRASVLRELPYQNGGLGVQMKVAAGIYGKVQDSLGSVKIYRRALLGGGPSITLTSLPNTTGSAQLSPQYLATLETAGVRNQLTGYQFEHLTLNARDAVMIWQYQPGSRSMRVTARIMAPDRVLEAVCSTGSGNQGLYTRACDESLRSIALAGPPSQLPKLEQVVN
ncbi:MAG: hypothetical protein ACRD1N_03075 [Terriglobia bacterium]